MESIASLSHARSDFIGQLLPIAQMEAHQVIAHLQSQDNGLSSSEAYNAP